MDFALERGWWQQGVSAVAGVDEVGRGPLAGPVFAAACVVPQDDKLRARLLAYVRDSKALSAAAREDLHAQIGATCLVGVGEASVAEIDALNIRQATHVAMRRALAALPHNAYGAVLVDGNDIPQNLNAPAQFVIKGDAVELAIACASIVAKVRRDALMADLGRAYPMYGWAGNAGYGTAAHLAALNTHGVTPHHRTTFAPVRALLEKAA